MSGPIGINYMPPDAPTASAGSVSVATQPSSALHNAELAAGAYVQALQGSPPQGFSLQIGARLGADCRGGGDGHGQVRAGRWEEGCAGVARHAKRGRKGGRRRRRGLCGLRAASEPPKMLRVHPGLYSKMEQRSRARRCPYWSR